MLAKPPKKHYKLFPNCSCAACPLAKKNKWGRDMGKGFSLPRGTGKNGVMFLADSLGEAEVIKGLPLMGASGFQMKKAISMLNKLHGGNIKDDDFLFWSAIACQPPYYRESTKLEVEHCDQYFEKVIQEYRPKVIMPIGEIALEKLLGIRGIMDVPKQRKPKRGYVWTTTLSFPSGFTHKCFIIPTIDPAYLLKGKQNLLWAVVQDINKALSIAKKGWPTYKPTYILHPSEADAKVFVRDAKTACSNGYWLTPDIETPYSPVKSEEEYNKLDDQDILRIGFAYQPEHAITFPFTQQYMPYIQELLEMPWEYLVYWYYLFDVPRLRDKGLKMPSKILDGMWLFHWWQSDVPKSLGFVSSVLTPLPEWKSQSTEKPEWYNCCDVDAQITNVYNLEEFVKEEGRW